MKTIIGIFFAVGVIAVVLGAYGFATGKDAWDVALAFGSAAIYFGVGVYAIRKERQLTRAGNDG